MTVTHKPRGQVADKAFFRGHDEFLPCVPFFWMTYDKSLRRGHDRTCVSRGHGTSQKMTSFSRGQARTVRGHGHMYSLRTYTVRNETKKTRIGATIGKCSCVFHCTKVLTKLTFSAARTQDPAKTFGSQAFVSWLVSLPTPCRLEPKKATKNIEMDIVEKTWKNLSKWL